MADIVARPPRTSAVHSTSKKATALLTHALAIATDNNLLAAAQRCHTNLAALDYHRDDYSAADAHARNAVALAREYSDRHF